MKRVQAGFSLVELLVVIAIAGILATIAIPLFLNQRTNSRNGATRATLMQAVSGMRAYYADNDNYNAFTAGSGSTAVSFPYEPKLGMTNWTSGQYTNSPGATSNPSNIIVRDAWLNTNRDNDKTTLLVCNTGHGDTSYCVLNITEPDSNFAGVAPGLYFGKSEGVDWFATPSYPTDGIVQALGEIYNKYPKSW
jgi:prepilin-type N-terminal cleavage/methylation domain-containing protein